MFLSKQVLGVWLLILACVSVVTGSAKGSEWYEEHSYSCDQTGSVITVSILNAILRNSHPAGGTGNRIYFRFAKADFESIVNTPTHSRETATATLTPSNVKQLKNHFQSMGNAAVPYYVSAIAAAASTQLPTAALQVLFRTSWTVFRALIASGSSTVTSQELAVLMADGGVLHQVLTASYDDKNRPFVARSIIYGIQVGNEKRNYTLMSCTFAVQLT